MDRPVPGRSNLSYRHAHSDGDRTYSLSQPISGRSRRLGNQSINEGSLRRQRRQAVRYLSVASDQVLRQPPRSPQTHRGGCHCLRVRIGATLETWHRDPARHSGAPPSIVTPGAGPSVATSGVTPSALGPASGDWATFGYDLQQTRHVPCTQIAKENIDGPGTGRRYTES